MLKPFDNPPPLVIRFYSFFGKFYGAFYSKAGQWRSGAGLVFFDLMGC
jgi:hypothetical protein